jgi:hypothetical protein
VGAKVTGLEELDEDLQRAIADAIPAAKKIAGKGALKVKKRAREIIKANSPHGYLPHYPYSISYDVTAHGPVVTAEIGPKTEKLQGGLGRIIEEGTVNNSPIPHLSPALDEEENTFYGYMEDLGESLLEGRRVDGPAVDPDS